VPDRARERLRDQFADAIVVGNKSDLPSPWEHEDLQRLDVRCSAKTGAGVEELTGAIVRCLVPATPPPGTAVPFTSRQVAWLARHAGAATTSGCRGGDRGLPEE
jgi:tRNA U34 5-carboxymethylaminomethyl modifying GTPase MnmE/TrmE